MSVDYVNLIEKGYRAQPDAESWLSTMADDIIPEIGADWVGGAAYLADFPKPPRHVVAVCREGSPVDVETNLRFVREAHASATPAQARSAALAMQTPGIASMVELSQALPSGITAASPLPVRDSGALFVHSGDERIAVFSNVTATRLRFDGATKRLWQRIAIHLGSGCRLAGRAGSTDAADVEAVIGPNGDVAHALGEAQSEEARELLRTAVKNMDRARTRAGRSDPLQALELWRGLIAGRWVLVDHFDSDGRRFILARRTEPDAPATAALSRRQRQIVFYASVGCSNKEIGYALGLAENTVSAHLTRSLNKLRIATRAELVRLSTQVATAAMHQLRH